MQRWSRVLILTFLFQYMSLQASFACTDFTVKTSSNNIVNGRSMEWGATEMHSRIVVHPRAVKYQASAPNNNSGYSWTSKYGYLGVDANGLDLTLDGMNEKGLSFGLLWLPGFTQYEEVSPQQYKAAVQITELGDWILGNFETVDQVKEALPDIHVWAQGIPSFGGIPTAHLALHDRNGRNLVIEFINGEKKTYDNPISVMTNAPTFDWQIINLANYISINPDNPKPINIDGTILASPGQGGGLLGIPGDWTPPSHFVRTACMLKFAKPVDTTEGGVNLVEHILNTVDIPRGAIREEVKGKEFTDYTQWIVIKSLNDNKFYFRSYENMNLRMLDLNKIDFANKQKRYINIDGGSAYNDISDKLK